MFSIVPIRSSNAEAIEDLGTKAKFWYFQGGTRMLFKAEERGTGEDWAEKIVCELAALLGLPHVHYEMAHDLDQDRPGVICASLAPAPLALAHGNQLMLALDPAYPNDHGQHFHCRAHTVDAVFDVVRRLRPPTADWCANLPAGVETAPDVFAGYLMLDAWVANQDRHHENWGAVWDGRQLSLASSFDHGASLARNLSDDERLERLQSHDANRRVPKFARRARSALYAEPTATKALSTLDAWLQWAAKTPAAAAVWRRQLAQVSRDTVDAVIASIHPDRMTAISRQFTLDLLVENRWRILESEGS